MPKKRTTNTLGEILGVIFPPFKIAYGLNQWWRDRKNENRYWPQAIDAFIRLFMITAIITLYFFSISQFGLDSFSLLTLGYPLSIGASLIAGLLTYSTKLGTSVAQARGEMRTSAARIPLLLLGLSIVTTGLQYFAATTSLTLPSGLAEFSTLFDLFGPAGAIALSLTALALPLLALTTYRYISLRQEAPKLKNPLTFSKFCETLLFGDSPVEEDNAENNQDLSANPSANGTNTSRLLSSLSSDDEHHNDLQQHGLLDTTEHAETASAPSDSKSADQDQTPPPQHPSSESVLDQQLSETRQKDFDLRNEITQYFKTYSPEVADDKREGLNRLQNHWEYAKRFFATFKNATKLSRKDVNRAGQEFNYSFCRDIDENGNSVIYRIDREKEGKGATTTYKACFTEAEDQQGGVQQSAHVRGVIHKTGFKKDEIIQELLGEQRICSTLGPHMAQFGLFSLSSRESSTQKDIKTKYTKIMRRAPGHNLKQLLDSGHIFSLVDMLALMLSVTKQVQTFHRLNVLHTDVLSGNIMVELSEDTQRVLGTTLIDVNNAVQVTGCKLEGQGRDEGTYNEQTEVEVLGWLFKDELLPKLSTNNAEETALRQQLTSLASKMEQDPKNGPRPTVSAIISELTELQELQSALQPSQSRGCCI